MKTKLDKWIEDAEFDDATAMPGTRQELLNMGDLVRLSVYRQGNGRWMDGLLPRGRRQEVA